MIYQGQFQNINEDLFTVNIYVSDGAPSTVYELTLGGDPFVTEMDNEDGNLYKPVKYQSATVNLITSDYLLNLYNATATNVGVELLKGDEVLFIGYVTPNLYDQGYKYDREEILVECTDTLATLKNINYVPSDLGNKSLLLILQWLCSQLPKPNQSTNESWIQYIEFPMVYSSSDDNTVIGLDNLYVSDFSFFDDKDGTETYQDVCSTCDEVLEAIAQYFGFSVIQVGQTWRFVDYDELITGKRSYIVYDVKTGEQTTIEDEVVNTYSIDKDSFASDDSTISLDKVYKKVSVKDELTEIDDIIPDIFDSSYCTNVTKSTDSLLDNKWKQRKKHSGDWLKTLYIGDILSGYDYNECRYNYAQFLFERTYKGDGNKYNGLIFTSYKWLYNPYITCYSYDFSNHTNVDTPTTMSYENWVYYRGGYLADIACDKLDIEKFNYLGDNVSNLFGSIDTWTKIGDISSVGYSKYICFMNPYEDNIDNPSNLWSYPYLKINSIDSTCFIGGAGKYIVISGTVFWHYMDDQGCPTPDGIYQEEDDDKKSANTNIDDYLFLPCRLKWGDYYWDGEEWTKSVSNFKLYYKKWFYDSDNKVHKTIRAHNLYCKDFTIPSKTTDFRDGLDQVGYTIPLPDENLLLNGTPELTFYRPVNPKYSKSKHDFIRPTRCFIKDFKMELVQADPTYSDSDSSDTIYTNLVDDNYIEELKEISFDLCTYDRKKNAYNNVVLKTDSYTYKYIDKLFHATLKDKETEWETSDIDAPAGSNGLRAEEHFIYRLVNQYQKPNLILEADLHDYTGMESLYYNSIFKSTMICDSVDFDFKYNKQTVRLIQKQ